MAIIGDKLIQPEAGWKRFDDMDSNIKYNGTWSTSQNITDYYNQTRHYTKNVDSSVEFAFVGTGIRVITRSSAAEYGKVNIEINGKTESYMQRGADGFQRLLYEKVELPLGTYYVKLTSPDGMIIDAFDIQGGSLVTPAKVGDKLTQPEPGWTRYDDTHALISYEASSGSWGIDSSYPYYGGTSKYKSGGGDGTHRVKITFKGTKIRLIGTRFTASFPQLSTVLIDGVEAPTKYDQRGSISNQFITLLFESPVLTEGEHSVEIIASKDAFDLDAIDILQGSLVKPSAKVGDVLLQPEDGWKRFDDSDSYIKYSGTWSVSTSDKGSYNDTVHFTSSTSPSPVSATFVFYGTSLRIIGIMSQFYQKGTIVIDDVAEEVNFNKVGDGVQSVLVYEKLNLVEGKHTVTISGELINLDAIDVNSDGYLVKPATTVGDVLLQPESGWKRFDDGDSNIRYAGNWTNSTSTTGAYNKTVHYHSLATEEVKASFVFTGTKLRLLALSSYFRKKAILKIDGVEYNLMESVSKIPPSGVHQTLLFEVTQLSNTSHLFELSGDDLVLDAIDIEETGSISKPPVKIGDQLKQPEDGWKRLDNTDANFKYRGTWYQGSHAEWYNGTYIYVKDNDPLGAVEFDFYGTQLRIISCVDVPTYRSDDVTITIDGVTEKYSEVGSSNIGQVLAYEKLGLTKGKHKVRIQCGTKGQYRLNFDAIDIDPDGYIEWPPYVIGDIVTTPEPGWRRFDDNALEILYDANWAKNLGYSGSYGGKSTCAHKGKNSSFRFKFKGTKFRFIVGCSTTEFYSDKISVRIDDLPLEFFDANAPKDTNQVLKYEKLGLEDKEHEVKVTVITSQPGAASYDYRMDALDIDSTGSLIKIITTGDALTQPEPGWRRIDDTDPLIRYIGNWKVTTGNDKNYNKTGHYNTDKTLDTSFEFEFVGTKLRLLAYGDSGYDAISKILIDGKEETIVFNAPSGNQIIRYEKLELPLGRHTVKVTGKAMALDSIDIDADGYLLARIGDKLVQPEPGWVRFDDTDKNIEYNGFWKTTQADVNVYNNTHHWKSKADNNDSMISARFSFKGTKFRLISMTSPSYEGDIELKIDGQKEILKLAREGLQYQTFAYEKKNLDDMIHVVELSGKYISIDAIDLEEGVTLLKLPEEKLKPYQVRSGLIFIDDFDMFDSRWIASPVGSYSPVDRQGHFTLKHNVSRDTLLLTEVPNEKEFAFEVWADYTPTHEDDKGGIMVWKNGEENIQFLESADSTLETTELKWLASKEYSEWNFFSDHGNGFDFCDSDVMDCTKFGVVLKRGSNDEFKNLDVDRIIATRGRKLTITNLSPNMKVTLSTMKDEIVFVGNTGPNTGIQIVLPSLEFEGKLLLTDSNDNILGMLMATFYGGDIYGLGSSLEVRLNGTELSVISQTKLPDMINGKSETMFELVNPSITRATNIALAVSQYQDKFGWSWVDIALDENGVPGQFGDVLNISKLNPSDTVKFWLKVTKGSDYMGLEPLQFQIHLQHD